eukprot:23192-Eustigmatos_ZCMA.PRE.1
MSHGLVLGSGRGRLGGNTYNGYNGAPEACSCCVLIGRSDHHVVAGGPRPAVCCFKGSITTDDTHPCKVSVFFGWRSCYYYI